MKRGGCSISFFPRVFFALKGHPARRDGPTPPSIRPHVQKYLLPPLIHFNTLIMVLLATSIQPQLNVLASRSSIVLRKFELLHPRTLTIDRFHLKSSQPNTTAKSCDTVPPQRLTHERDKISSPTSVQNHQNYNGEDKKLRMACLLNVIILPTPILQRFPTISCAIPSTPDHLL
jgi:hypothetical protein